MLCTNIVLNVKASEKDLPVTTNLKLHNPIDRKNHLTVVFGHKFRAICVLLMFSCARITSANLRNHTYFAQLHCKCTRHFLLHCFCHSRTKNTYTNILLLCICFIGSIGFETIDFPNY